MCGNGCEGMCTRGLVHVHLLLAAPATHLTGWRLRGAGQAFGLVGVTKDGLGSSATTNTCGKSCAPMWIEGWEGICVNSKGEQDGSSFNTIPSAFTSAAGRRLVRWASQSHLVLAMPGWPCPRMGPCSERAWLALCKASLGRAACTLVAHHCAQHHVGCTHF